MPSAIEEGVRAIGEPDTVRDTRGVVIVEVRERTIEQSRRSHTSEARRSLQPTGNENSRHSGRRDSGDLDAILDFERVADELGRMGGVDEANGFNHEHGVGGDLDTDVGLRVCDVVEHPSVFRRNAIARAAAVPAHPINAHTCRAIRGVVCALDQGSASLDVIKGPSMGNSRLVIGQPDGASAR